MRRGKRGNEREKDGKRTAVMCTRVSRETIRSQSEGQLFSLRSFSSAPFSPPLSSSRISSRKGEGDKDTRWRERERLARRRDQEK